MTRLLTVRSRIADLDAGHAALASALEADSRPMTADERAKVAAERQELAALKQEESFLADAQAAQKASIAATVPTLDVGRDRAESRPWGPQMPDHASADTRTQVRQAGLGEWAIAVKNVLTGRGTDPRLFAAASGLGTAIPSDGGFAIPQDLAPGIEQYMFAGGELLSRVDARPITGNNMAYVVVNETDKSSTRAGGVLHYWVDEAAAPTASKPTFARVEFKLRKVGCLGYATDELIADAAALGGELEKHFGYELTFGVEDAITEGSGVNKPLGYLSAPCLVSVDKETNQTAATINAFNLSKMWARLSTRSKSNAVWLINGDCGPQLDMLSIPAGTGALEPRFVNYSPAGILTIKGRPVIETEYNATLGTVGDIALIDLSQYRLIRKGGVEQASSIHVLFTAGEMTYRAFYRCDGAMMPRSAVTPFKGGSTKTLSPVVVLATRS